MVQRQNGAALQAHNMRWFISNLIATFTGPRYFPEVKWSKNLWTHNVFRVLGMLIGEPYGIRPSTALLPDGRQIAYTFEAQLALFEATIRAWLKREFGYQLVLIPSYQLAGLTRGGFVPYRFAIAFNNSVNGSNNNNPVSFTTTGSNLAVFADTLSDITATTNGNVTAMAYGSTSLSLTTPNYRYPSDRWNVGACGGGVSAGTANVSETGSTFSYISATSYTGCASSQPDSTNGSDNGGAKTSSLTLSTTVVASNCWLVGSIYGGGSYSGGSGTTKRTTSFSTAIMDSNGTVGTGSQSLVMNQGNDFVAANIVSIAPHTTAAVNSGFFFALTQ